MPKIQITIVPREIGQIFDELLEQILTALTLPPVQHGKQPLTSLIPHHYYPKYNVYQGQCYKQYTGNLCGYHATFNALCCLHMFLNIKSQYVMKSGASFWKFKGKVEKFLLEIKQANKLVDKWPWRQQDIKYGDFQRTYNNICIDYFDDFDIFKQHSQFTYMSATWQFQYQNIVLSEDARKQLNKQIHHFNTYQGQKPLIFGIMLGITCHWTFLIGFKQNGKTQYWFFDSRNENQLDYSDEDTTKWVQLLDQLQLVKRKTSLSSFQREKMTQSIKDTQISIKLLIDCLEGKGSLDQYAYNQFLNVFAKHLVSSVQYFDQKQTLHTIKQYWYNISSFFKQTVKWDLLTPESIQKMAFIFKLAEQLKNTGDQGRSFYSVVKKHSVPKGLF